MEVDVESIGSDTILQASDDLVNMVSQVVQDEGLTASRFICHNVEDYHTYNFPNFLILQGKSSIRLILLRKIISKNIAIVGTWKL